MLEKRTKLSDLPQDPCFGYILERRSRIPTLTEVIGEFGSGKSQLCHTLCVTANNTNLQTNGGAQKLVGKINPIIFIDTENTFRPERVHQIAEARGLTTKK